jgi:hypothetical protein
VTDPITTSRSAREALSRGLNALQADPTVPPQLVELAAPIAQAMGALHQLERSQQLAPHADVALGHVRGALAQLQGSPTGHPAVATALESVAQSLSLVHSLSRMANGPAPQAQAAPQGPPPAPAFPVAPPINVAPPPHAPPPQAVPQANPNMGTAAMAAQRPPAPQPQAAPHAPPPQHMPPPQAQHMAPPQHAPQQAYPQPAPPQQAHGGGAPPMVARDPFAAPPAAAPQPGFAPPGAPLAPAGQPATPSMPVPAPPPPQGGTQLIAADLGAHSATNFYKGLSGNDIIDHGGLFVSTYALPKINTQVRLKVSLPGGYEFEANAVVRWSREATDDAPPGFGAQFTGITPEARPLVYRYVRNREPLFHDDL